MKAARIALATPWNVKSAIAQSAAEVAFELARRGHAVTVLRTEVASCRDIPARDAPGDVSFMAEYSDVSLRQDFDVILGHLGNYYGYHGALLSRMTTIPIVGIFHDLCMAHLMRDWLGDDQSRLRALVRDIYAGSPAADAPFAWDDLSYVVHHHPLIEWAAARTIGAVVHAPHYKAIVEAACDGPLAVIPLAFTVPPLSPPAFTDGMTIAIVGHANPNKRIDKIMMAVAASPILRDLCRIKIIGEAAPEMRDRLTTYATTLRIIPPIFTGWVPDDELSHALRDVDVMACLRQPVLEGASASLIVALASGRPTLVTNHGAYADVPDDAGLKCCPGREVLDVMMHLERLVRLPSLKRSIGARGQAFSAERHTASAYADALEPFIELCMADAPKRGAEYALRQTLASFGLPSNDPAVTRILGAFDTVFA